MDRENFAHHVRAQYAFLCVVRESLARAGLYRHVDGIDRAILAAEQCARLVLGPSFCFEPDMQRKTDATPARMTALRPVAAAQPERPALAVIPGGASSTERPSARYIDDEPEAG